MRSALYVGDLHPTVTKDMIIEKFSTAGPITSVRLIRDWNSSYALVNFQHRADAERAVEMFHLKFLIERPMHITWSHKDPSLRYSRVGNLIIKNLDKSIDNMGLHESFSMFGTIQSCKVVGNKKGSKGYGYVQFTSEAAAEKAMKTLNGKPLNSRQVFIEHFKSRAERETEAGSQSLSSCFTNILIKNLDQEMDEKKLKEVFRLFGVVLSASVMTDENGKSKGYGFVNFKKPEEARRAVAEMNGMELNGKELYVGQAKTNEEKQTKNNQKSEQDTVKAKTDMDGRVRGGKLMQDDVIQHKCQECQADVHRQNNGTITPSTCQVPQMGEMCASTNAETITDAVPVANSIPAVDTVPVMDSDPVVDTVPITDSDPVVDPVVPVECGLVLAPYADDASDAPIASSSEVQSMTDTKGELKYVPARKYLTINMLKSAQVDDHIEMAYNYMLPLVEKVNQTQPKKITWMLLESASNYDIMNMMRDTELLCARVDRIETLLKGAGHKLEILKMFLNNGSKNTKWKKKRTLYRSI